MVRVINDFPSKTTLLPFDDDFLLLLLVVGRRPEVNDFPTTFRRRRPLAFESAFVVITGFFFPGIFRLAPSSSSSLVVVLVAKKEKFRGTMEENEEDDGFSRARAFFDSVVFGPKASSSAKDAGTFDRIPFQHCSNLRRLKKRRHRRRLRALRRARTLQSIRDLTRRMHRHTRRCPDDMCTSRPRPTRAQRGGRDDGLTRVVRQKRQDAYDGHVRSRRETTRENHGILHVRTERRERRRGRDGKPHEIFRRDRTETVTTNAGFFEVLNEIETTRRTKRKRKRRRRF